MSLGCDPTDVSSPGIATFEDGLVYWEGAEDTIDGQVEGDMFDIERQRRETIKYRFSPYKCSAFWEIMESFKKLIEHMSAKPKDDFIEFSCVNCNKSNPRLKGIAIHYGLCTKGLTGRGSKNVAGKSGETAPVIVDDLRESAVNHENFTDSEAVSSVSSTGDLDLTTQDEVDLPVTVLHECSMCHKNFKSKSGLGQHIRHNIQRHN